MYHDSALDSDKTGVSETITASKIGLQAMLSGVTSSSTSFPLASHTTSPSDDRLYLAAQAIVCYLQAVNNRCKLPQLQLAKILALMQQDDASNVLSSTLSQHSDAVPTWLWVAWIPQLLAGVARSGFDDAPLRKLLQRIAVQFPQALYCTLRAFVLEKREIAAGQSGSVTTSAAVGGVEVRSTSGSGGSREQVASVIAGFGEELLHAIRNAHHVLASDMESVLEEVRGFAGLFWVSPQWLS